MLEQFKQHWFLLLLICGLALSFAAPTPGLVLAASFKNLTGQEITRPAVFLLLLLTSLSFNLQELANGFRSPGPILLSLCGTYLLLPTCFYLGNWLLLGLDSALGIGLMVLGGVPTSLASAAIWTRLAGGNTALCVAMIVVNNLASVLLGPIILEVCCGRALVFPFQEMIWQLCLSVLLPVLLGQVVACCLKERRKTWAPTIGGLSRCIVVGVVMLSAAKAAGKSAELEASGAGATAGQLLELILICVMAHLIVVGLLELLGRGLRFAKSTRIAVVFVGAQKTLPVGIYMLTIFFTGMELGVFSLVAYHSLQLVIDTFLIDVYTRASDSTRSA